MKRATIVRLEYYLMFLTEMKAAGRKTVTSEDLAGMIGISSSRVRQDLIALRALGRPHSGYEICELEALIYGELGLFSEKGMALVGCGNLGRALAHSGIWDHAGFALRAIFDTDSSVIGTQVGSLTVRHLRELYGVVKSERIETACLTVPAPAAQAVVDQLVQAGIRGIWNFAPVDLQAPPHIIVENQHLEQGLMTLSYLLKAVGGAGARPSTGRSEESNDTSSTRSAETG